MLAIQHTTELFEIFLLRISFVSISIVVHFKETIQEYLEEYTKIPY